MTDSKVCAVPNALNAENARQTVNTVETDDKALKRKIRTEILAFLNNRANEQLAEEEKRKLNAAKSKNPEECKVDDKIGRRFIVKKKIRQGGFGIVYEAFDELNERSVALKCQKITGTSDDLEEIVLKSFQKSAHCPEYYGGGVDEIKRCCYVAMQLLHKSLSDARRECKLHPRRLSVKACFAMAVQCVEAIDGIHSLGYLHRDVKPSNFLVGRGDSAQTLYMIDFGLCRYYLDEKGAVKEPRASVGFRGTVRYASVAAHELKELARKDDLRSLFYSLRELLTGRLPWRRSNDKHVVGKMKAKYTPALLCNGLPSEVAEYAAYVESLNYADQPDYGRLTECLRRALQTHCAMNAKEFDWQVSDCTKLRHLELSADIVQ